MPISISSKKEACCSSSSFVEPSFSDRRPNRARSKAFRDLRQPLDARSGIGANRLPGHGKRHGFQHLYSFGRLRTGGVIGRTRAHFASNLLLFSSPIPFAAVLLPNTPAA